MHTPAPTARKIRLELFARPRTFEVVLRFLPAIDAVATGTGVTTLTPGAARIGIPAVSGPRPAGGYP